VPSPASTTAVTLWRVTSCSPAKPLLAASAMRERLQLASAPSELVTPGTASAASSASLASASAARRSALAWASWTI